MTYMVEYSVTVEVEAEDALDAWQKADLIVDFSDPYVYVDGNLIS